VKISFTKKILVIGSIFCGLISPIKAEDKLEINPRTKFEAAATYGYLLCLNKKDRLYNDEEFLTVVKGSMKRNKQNPKLIEDEAVIKVSERIARLKGKNCAQNIGKEFYKEQMDFLRKDHNSIVKYEKASGRKFTKEERTSYWSIKFHCNNLGKLGEDLDKCVKRTADICLSENFNDNPKECIYSLETCYKSEEWNKKYNILPFWGYKNFEDCMRTNVDADKICLDKRRGIYSDKKKFEKWYMCKDDYTSNHLIKLSNERRKIRFNEINRNEDLILFEKKFCWDKERCWETYYDKNSFKVTTDGVTFFDKRRLKLTEKYHPTYDEKSILGIDCATKEFVEKRGRKNILFPKDATREQKEMYAVKRFKKEYELACKGEKFPTINKTSQEMFVTQKDNMFSEEMNQELFESTKEGMRKIDKSSKKQEQKSDNDAHQTCLKAADYKGCMKYQNR
tara:strand:- start:1470 stop:2822 length:1353 start_codon:yes stop_codon:yes gene_type:complete